MRRQAINQLIISKKNVKNLEINSLSDSSILLINDIILIFKSLKIKKMKLRILRF